MIVEEPTLFDAAAFVVLPSPGEAGRDLSPDRLRTLRQEQRLLEGTHPLQSIVRRALKLHVEAAPVTDRKAPGRRCGNCRFRIGSGWGDTAGHYPKCWFGRDENDNQPPPRYTRSAASDVRAWWPACTDHEWIEERSDQAA